MSPGRETGDSGGPAATTATAGAQTTGVLADWALLPSGWARNVALTWNRQGVLVEVSPEARASSLPPSRGPVVAGMPNLHSHAFQRALVGMTQHPDPGADFWSWRTAMYRLAGLLNPDLLYACSAWLFSELVAAGYTSVVEFHYVHRPGGSPAEVAAEAILRAAGDSGIRLTLAPVLYRWGGFGNAPLDPGQKPFNLDCAEYERLIRHLQGSPGHGETWTLAVAPHSLRAVSPEDLAFLVDLAGPDTPIHLHISEQPAEVEGCRRHLKETPIRWLASRVPLGPRWALVHATHADQEELALLAARGTTIVLCPTTEHDLGDGRFPSEQFTGKWGVGSDSQVSVSPAEELRQILYGMRASLGRRAVLPPGRVSDGTSLWTRAATGHEAVTGHRAGSLEPGRPADLLVLNPASPLLEGLAPDQALSAFILSGGADQLRTVYVGGKVLANEGRHIHAESLLAGWVEAMHVLRPGLP